MRKVLAVLVALVAYVGVANVTAFIANHGFGWLSVFVLAALMVGGTYTVDRMV